MRPQQVQLYGKYQSPPGYVNPALQVYYQPIDLSPADPIVFSDSVTDLEDPTEVLSGFSQTFRVPGTSNNSIFFSMAFEVNSDDFNPTLKVDAYLAIEGLFFAQGYLTLESIYTDGLNNVNEYEIQFFGQTRSFGGAIEGKYLAELDLSQYNHLLTYSNVIQSWNAGTASPALLNGDVIYPLCEWGYDYNPEISRPIIPTVSVYDGSAPNPTSLNGFTNSSNPLFVTQFKPFLRAKAIWDQIFEEAGFTYTSDFIAGGTGSFFEQLYYVSTRDATSRLFIGTPFTNSFGPPVIVNLPVSLQQYIRIVFATDPAQQDYYNAYDPSLGLYTCPLDIPNMTHVINLRFEYGTPGSTSPQFTLRLRRNRPGVGITTVWIQTVTGLPAAFPNNAQYSGTFAAVLGAQQVGDIFSWEILFPIGLFSNVRISGNQWTIDFPFGVNLSMMFPEDQYTQAEFIKSINTKFNLIWQPDPNNPNNFLIEPWINWVGGGNQYSWTEKLDESSEIQVQPLFKSQSRNLIFTDASAGDLNNFNFENQYDKIFGQFNLDSGIQLLTGDRDISTSFSPVPLSPIGVSNQMLIPHFAVDSETERLPMQVGPRLVFYNGMIDNPVDVPTWYMLSDLNVSVPFSQFPLVSQFSTWPPDNDAFDLNWTNSPQYWNPALNNNITGQVSNNAYTVFWQRWYEAYYSPYSRVMTATFVLNPTDVKYLNFNDLIWVKNAWWMPVRYDNYLLGEIQKVEVELVKFWPPLGISIGGTGSGLPNNNYFKQQTCYGTTACEACCCLISQPIVYSDGPTLATSNFIYLTANGGFPAAGYYAQNSQAFEVLSDGSIVGSSLCSLCDCAQVLPEFLTEYEGCSGPTPCDAFCCGATAFIYIDGPITGATELFSSAGAEPLAPFNWYHIPGTDWIYQVGANGYTVVQGGTGGFCNCPDFTNSEILSVGHGASGPEAACCVEGVSGASGPFVIYYDDSDWFNSTDFAYDPFNDVPVGDPTEEFISDGEFYIGVSGGTAGTTGDCVPNTCPGRSNQVDTRLINQSGVTGATLISINYITFDFSTSFWANQDSASGTTFNYNYLTGYSPDSGIQTVVSSDVDGDIFAVVNKDSIIIYQDTFPVSAGSSYSLPTFAAGTASWFIEVEIIPT